MRCPILLAVAVVCLVSGCATTESLKDMSMGHTGCTQDEMVIADVTQDFPQSQWVVRAHVPVQHVGT
jgi:uncharacterized protein YceK